MKKYYGKFKGDKAYHIIHADSVAEARTKMRKGTRYKANEVIIKTKEPKTKFPICGR